MYIWTMDFYQEQATQTMKRHPNHEVAELYFAGALCGEAGETFELVKKHIRDEKPLDREKLLKELGDVLWYVTANCDLHGLRLSDVAAANIAKLRERYGHEFDAKNSHRNRDS